MGSTPNGHHRPSPPPKPLSPSQNPNPKPPPPLHLATPSDAALLHAGFLTREELLRRRSRRLRQLAAFYKDQYWALMEEVRVRYREYYWRYGRSAVEDGGGEVVECRYAGCKAKAMALTSFCHQHILSDARQTLYKACTYVIKSAQSGQLTCGKPVLRSAVPSLCSAHFQKAQRHISQALKKAGLNMSSSSRLAPKVHVLVTEYVRQIQVKRKEARRAAKLNIMYKDKVTE